MRGFHITVEGHICVDARYTDRLRIILHRSYEKTRSIWQKATMTLTAGVANGIGVLEVAPLGTPRHSISSLFRFGTLKGFGR